MPARLRSFVSGADGRPAVGLPPRTVEGECRVLAAAVDAIGRTWWAGDMLVALTAAAGHLARALHEHEQTVPIGACPQPAPGYASLFAALVDDIGEILASRGSTLPRCGGPVRARSFGDAARCRQCGHRWDGEAEVRKLGAQLGDAMLDLPGLSRYLGVESLATLRSWAHREGWQRHRTSTGRTLYRLADARASWWRSWDRRNPVHGPVVPPGWARGAEGWRELAAV